MSKGKILTLMSVSFLTLLMILSYIPVVLAEPSLFVILTTTLGFNVNPVTIETFPAGRYEITLYAEYAGYRHENTLSLYTVGTSDFTLIFDGPEGAGDPMGIVDPPLTKSLIGTEEFGISLWSPDLGGHRFFTETYLNYDGQKHAMVYQNVDDPNMFFIGFENLEGGGDFDYNDIVFSLRRIFSVGGVWTPVERFDLPTSWISLISAILLASLVYVKLRKRIE